MKHRRSFTKHILPLLVLTPYIVAFQPDSTNTTIRFGAGIGPYADVTRDCKGHIMTIDQIPFNDAGIAIEHDIAPLHLGAKAGVVSEKRTQVSYAYTPQGLVKSPPREKRYVSTYANPTIGLQWKYFGLDAGCIWFHGDGFGGLWTTPRAIPQGALRIGNRDSWFWSVGVFDNVPLLSRGGLVDMGFGFSLDHRHSTLWLGVGCGVYDGTVYAVKSDIAIGDRWFLNVGLTAGDNSQLAGSLGAGIRF